MPLTFCTDVDQPEEHWAIAQRGVQRVLEASGVATELLPMSLPDGLRAIDAGEADLSVNFREQLSWSYRGIQRPPHPNLRALGRLLKPRYVGVAVAAQTGITALEQVASERRPVHLVTIPDSPGGMGYVCSRICQLSGFTHPDLISWGGKVYTGPDGLKAIMDGEADMLLGWALSSWGASWGKRWLQAQIRRDLRFLPIPDHVRDTLVQEMDLTKGAMPAGLFRGLDVDVPTFVTNSLVVSTHASLAEELGYRLVEALDRYPEYLQQCAVEFAFNPRTACIDNPVPLHPGALLYYREKGYLE